MGGHTICPDGIVLNMLPFNRMDLDAEHSILHVGSGARWTEIVPYLDARGFSVAVMQSNNNFSVGGSLSVNCHGWQHNSPPIASTVESFRLMKADGSVGPAAAGKRTVSSFRWCWAAMDSSVSSSTSICVSFPTNATGPTSNWCRSRNMPRALQRK